MKKSNTNLSVTITEGSRNISFLLDFLANAGRDYLLISEIEQLEKLQQLLVASTDDQAFAEVFPQKDIDDFLDEHGKPLAYVRGDKGTHLRNHVIPHCARKAYDMLIGAHFANELNDVDVERFAACDNLYDAAVVVAKPMSPARSLKACLMAKLDRKAEACYMS